jgi:hypothetical protein
MKCLSFLAIVISLSVSSAIAGELFGTIAEGEKPVAQGVKVEVTAGDKTYSTETDKFGAYRLFVKEKGKWRILSLHFSRLGAEQQADADKPK